jgi:hypothetical protein
VYIGDGRRTKEPNPVCLPMTKFWDWHTGNAIADFLKFKQHYAVERNQGTLWMPGPGNGAPGKSRFQIYWLSQTPLSTYYTHKAWQSRHTICWQFDDFIQTSGHPLGKQWKCLHKWCLVAGQTGINSKSKVLPDTSPVTTDNEGFNY